ncbi:MAG: hypothetical protein U5L11_16910 [Arhodomonas sp.]|nr:hypothetical protein [Arhodomonas sp.]
MERPPDVMVLDCTHAPGRPGGNHNDPDVAGAEHAAVSPGRTLLTHISHRLDDWLQGNSEVLPLGMDVAIDGQVLDLG